MVILSAAYLPPVWYFSNLFSGEPVWIEAHEHFIKQTIRNRCHILSPNGIQSLIVPVVHRNRYNLPMRDIRISNDTPWQRQHLRSLQAAYRRSAFFEFYQDDFVVYYERKYEFLLDWNLALIRFLSAQLKKDDAFRLTEAYLPPDLHDSADKRVSCNSGKPEPTGNEISYPQVFSYKQGFVPGLSMVDLLFNMGPASAGYLAG